MRLPLLVTLVFALPTFMVAQDGPWAVAPGIVIPNSKTPWATDRYEGKDQWVPIHHSNVDINNHNGANLAGALTQSFFYKPKMTIELSGLHAHTDLHSGTPVIYLRVDDDEDPTPSDEDKGTTYTWVIARAWTHKDRRVFSQIRVTQLTGKAARQNESIPVKVEHLEKGWIRITPEQILEPDEYAIMPAYKSARLFPSKVFDFRVAPTSPNAPDAVSMK